VAARKDDSEPHSEEEPFPVEKSEDYSELGRQGDSPDCGSDVRRAYFGLLLRTDMSWSGFINH
jgi:hypothetical protein